MSNYESEKNKAFLAGLRLIVEVGGVDDLRISAEHEVLYVGIEGFKGDPGVNEKVLALGHGWHWDSEFECFGFFT